MLLNCKGYRLVLLAMSMLLTACAASVQTMPAHFTAASTGGELSIIEGVEVRLPTGYHRTLAEGGRWRKVGRVSEGEVYMAIGTVFTIEGRNVHEAYLILSPRHELVGFYLPGESNASMLPSAIPIKIKENS